MYTYKAQCTRVIDGDTAEFDVDLGFNVHHIIRGRFYGLNAPEIFRGDDEEKRKGHLVKEFVEDLILNKEVVVETHKDKMSFNRWIVHVFIEGKDAVELIKEYMEHMENNNTYKLYTESTK